MVSRARLTTYEKHQLQQVWQGEVPELKRARIQEARKLAMQSPDQPLEHRHKVLSLIPDCDETVRETLDKETMLWVQPLVQRRDSFRDVALLVGEDGIGGAWAPVVMVQQPLRAHLMKRRMRAEPRTSPCPMIGAELLARELDCHDVLFDTFPIQHIPDKELRVPGGWAIGCCSLCGMTSSGEHLRMPHPSSLRITWLARLSAPKPTRDPKTTRPTICRQDWI